MSIESRATEFVRRTDEALNDLDRGEELWTASIRSTTQEIRLHSLSLDLDKAIRMVGGPYDTWANLDPAHVQVVREQGPINLMWVISAHPSGHVREAFVRQTKHLENDRILPHLANRSVDFVPQIRELAGPLVIDRLANVLAAYPAGDQGPLPTPVHIAVTKLLAPRTAMVSPELLRLSIDLATAANLVQPRKMRGGGMAKMLDRCHQTRDATSEPASRDALELLIAYFNQAPVA